MVTFEYKVESIKVIQTVGELENVVYEVEWRIDATDGTYSAFYANSNRVSDPDPNNFTPFESLTETIVKSWYPSPLTQEMERYLTDLVEQKALNAQGQYQPLPWESV